MYIYAYIAWMGIVQIYGEWLMLDIAMIESWKSTDTRCNDAADNIANSLRIFTEKHGPVITRN